ncbi:MAG: hypothetical protein WC554_04805 [Clostridia bacterium]
MPGGKNENPNEEDSLEFDDTENYDDLDAVLNDDKDGEEEDEEKNKDNKKEEDDSSEKNKDKNKKDEENDNKFFKKVGNREFTSEEEYDRFVLNTYNTNSQFAGEIKKLGGDPRKLSKEQIKDNNDDNKNDKEEKKVLSDEENYYRIESIRFTKQFPIAKEYKEEMQILIRKGRANIGDEPSFALALAKSLRADGKPIPSKLISKIRSEKGTDEEESNSRTASKKVMKSGGSNSNSHGQESYSQEEKDSLSEFGDKIATGSISSF